MIPRKRRRDSGFALLLVFAMAAIVGILLFLELPRVAFESQRNAEDLLIMRGEQYKRAIQLYFRRFNRYPPTLEALENTNNVRFLRRRYKDPMTGKDEWRLVHAGPGGTLTDSLTQKPPQKKSDDPMVTNIGDSSTTSSSEPPPQPAYLARRRPSDTTSMPGGGGGFVSGEIVPGQVNAADPPVQPGQADNGQPPQPGMPLQPGQMGQPGMPLQPGQMGQPGVTPGGQPIPGQMGQPGSPYGGQPGQPPMYGPSVPGLPQPGDPQGGTATQPGSQPGPGNTPVPDMIRNMLTQPTQRPGLGGTQNIIGAGIAGVASKLEAEGIKSYNDRTKYNEWEFIYDPRKDLTSPMSQQSSMMQGPGMQPQPTGSQSTGILQQKQQ